MLSSHDQKRHRNGMVLVALQFGLLLVLAVMAASRVRRGDVPAAAWLLAASSVALAAWALLHNRLGNFNIRPAPKADGILITTGPYRLIRHPMYTAVLLGAGALGWLSEPVAAGVVWVALALVLWQKLVLEERWMREHHPDYDAYCQLSKRLLPWVI
jgi:protein-S-isoprenylcysteine O-methyltransferase Ste14